jgi:hypothetical protein
MTYVTVPKAVAPVIVAAVARGAHRGPLGVACGQIAAIFSGLALLSIGRAHVAPEGFIVTSSGFEFPSPWRRPSAIQ